MSLLMTILLLSCIAVAAGLAFDLIDLFSAIAYVALNFFAGLALVVAALKKD
jgi:hypothetical protein